MTESTDRILTLTTQIAVAYMGGNAVDARGVLDLLRAIHRSLAGREPDRAQGNPELIRSVKSRPVARTAVDLRKSVFADNLVCLEDGKHVMMLKRHLRTEHGLTPEQYREKWSLPSNYPMVAPDYAKIRSGLAKAAGLGKRGQPRK